MAKLFISYPSESWNFAQRIAEKLAERLDDSIFIDYRSIDQADFAEAILTHLRASDGVILVVTEFTFADIHRDRDWVRLEIRTALENNIPIVLVRENGLLPPADIPEDVRDVQRSQGIPFYREFFDPGVALLAEFLVKIGVGNAKTTTSAPRLIETSPAPPPPIVTPEPAQRTIGGQGSLEEAADLLEAGDHEKALVILETLHAQGNMRPVIAKMVDDLLAEGQRRRAEAERRHEARLDYTAVAAMARRKLTEARAREEFHDWSTRYADLIDEIDSDDLRTRFPQIKVISRPEPVSALLPQPFAWVDIPAGKVTVNSKTFDIPAFVIAKYPVTNAQFALFVQAGGYTTRQWWTDAGWSQREKDKWSEPRFWQDEKWNRADYPVVGVSWYEAVAYCLWLTETTAVKVMLPSEQQWQRAAQGDDGRAYPWGNDWDVNRCNNSVGQDWQKNQTSPVTRYEGKGDSPFGVVDMSGNVWEWCLTEYETGIQDINRTGDRVLRGGSWSYGDTGNFRCDYRGRYTPHFRDDVRGFRLSLS
jgi:formylglycine-generating enzyme required for sulfatase activity